MLSMRAASDKTGVTTAAGINPARGVARFFLDSAFVDVRVSSVKGAKSITETGCSGIGTTARKRCFPPSVD